MMKSEKTKVTYIFGFGRSKLISSAENFADEFFYGYFKLLNDKQNINYIEFEDNSEKLSFKIISSFISRVLRKVSKLSFFIENICNLKNFKILWNTNHIIATNDRIGISLLPFLIIYKLFNVNQTTVVVMGLLTKTDKKFNKSYNPTYFIKYFLFFRKQFYFF